MKLLPVLLSTIVIGLSACGPDGSKGRYELTLNDTIFNQLEDRYQITTDTLYGATADSLRQIVTEFQPGRRSYPADSLYWNITLDEEEAMVLRTWDSLPGYDNVVRMLDGNRMKVDLPAADIVLNGDSVRIGIMHVLKDAFFQGEPRKGYSDYIILTNWGTKQLPFAMDQDNIGPISKRTVFRISRNHYYIESIDSSRRQLVIKEIEDGRGMQTTAELDLYFKRVAAKTLAGEPVTIPARPGRQLVIYFWNLGSSKPQGEDIMMLDRLYQNLPAETRDSLDIVLINRGNSAEEVKSFIGKESISLPNYLAAPNTCRNLNCRPNLPYWVSVSAGGRVQAYFKTKDDLINMLIPLADLQ